MRIPLLLAFAVLPLASCGDCPCAPSGGGGGAPVHSLGKIIRKDPRFDKLIPPGAQMEILAGGFEWTEGPVWVKNGGYLLFSVIPPNKVCKWKEGEGVTIYLRPSGLTGPKDLRPEPGSNGLILDSQGRLVLCQHGDRRMARMDAPLDKPESKFVTLADRYEGKRFNSPNDGCYHSSGALYFTDPPYGLAEQTWVDGRKYFDRADDLKHRDELVAERTALIAKVKASEKKGKDKDDKKSDAPAKPSYLQWESNSDESSPFVSGRAGAEGDNR